MDNPLNIPKNNIPRFHLAFPVTDLAEARRFYTGVLGCKLGRESENWIDFDFYGHQIVAHYNEVMPECPTSAVEGKQVPTRHFGLLLGRDEWQRLANKLTALDIDFLIPPHIRFEGQPGEQATLFIQDPSGNGLEFKSFATDDDIFATK
ncbi:MAG: glyoxalase [Alphaproteobacteria bacterium]|nr:MAG: glyoxalase [Alphaproteobacteria bacterium]